MDNNFTELIQDVIASINLEPDSELTQIKIKTILEFINDIKDFPPYIYFITLFLLASSHCAMDSEVTELYHKTNQKIANFLLNYRYFPMTEAQVREYFDPNLANAIEPLNELTANIHKSGDIVHFIEHKYIDATGRKFVKIEVPNYDERQSILQFRLSEQLKAD